MHIPMELFLIFMRNSGITTGDKWGTYSDVEVHSCSSCGICINSCQMALAAGVTDIQPAYLIKSIRDNNEVNGATFNCLLCGRCEEVCPVGIETGPLRMIMRREKETETDMLGIWKGFLRRRNQNGKSSNGNTVKPAFTYLQPASPRKAEVAFFAGCMTHLTPSVIRSMEAIFAEAGINYTFIDREKGVCCGRPLMLAGQEREARELINYNSRVIWESGAKTVVTPCPICYKVFNESYYLDAEIMHHSQYIDSLIASGRLRLRYTGQDVVYHDPCELGRGSGVYDEPRKVLNHVARLLRSDEEEEMGLCCGGSLANLKASRETRRKIATSAAETLAATGASMIATGCPLCKKSFSLVATIPVKDIAEITVSAFYPDGAAVESEEATMLEVVR